MHLQLLCACYVSAAENYDHDFFMDLSFKATFDCLKENDLFLLFVNSFSNLLQGPNYSYKLSL